MEGTKEVRRRRPAPVAVSPPPRWRLPDHPPYAEMVQVALRALSEDGGSTEASLSRYIRRAYTGLPPGHARLLPYYLRKFVAAGEVSVPSPGRYALPNNPKPQNPNPNPTPGHHSSAGPRRRGRPRKTAAVPAVGHLASPGPIPPPPADARSEPSPARRGRGQPPRNSHGVDDPPGPAKPSSDGEPIPRPRLILRLQRKPNPPVGGEATTAAAGSWCCLKDGGKSGCTSLSEPDCKPFPEIGAVEERNAEAAPETECESLPPPDPASINSHRSNNGSSSSKPSNEEPVEPEPNLESSSSALVPPEPLEKELSFSSPALALTVAGEKKELSCFSPALAPTVAGGKKELSGSRRKSQAKHRRLWFEA